MNFWGRAMRRSGGFLRRYIDRPLKRLIRDFSLRGQVPFFVDRTQPGAERMEKIVSFMHFRRRLYSVDASIDPLLAYILAYDYWSWQKYRRSSGVILLRFLRIRLVHGRKFYSKPKPRIGYSRNEVISTTEIEKRRKGYSLFKQLSLFLAGARPEDLRAMQVVSAKNLEMTKAAREQVKGIIRPLTLGSIIFALASLGPIYSQTRPLLPASYQQLFSVGAWQAYWANLVAAQDEPRAISLFLYDNPILVLLMLVLLIFMAARWIYLIRLRAQEAELVAQQEFDTWLAILCESRLGH